MKPTHDSYLIATVYIVRLLCVCDVIQGDAEKHQTSSCCCCASRLHTVSRKQCHIVRWQTQDCTEFNKILHAHKTKLFLNAMMCFRRNLPCLRGMSDDTATDPRCHGNEIWAKIGYNSAYMWGISEILASNRGFSWSGYWTMPVKFYNDRPWLPWQRNLGQNWL